MVKRLTPNPAAIRATDGIGVLAGPTGSRSPMRDGTDGDKYKPLPFAHLPSEVQPGVWPACGPAFVTRLRRARGGRGEMWKHAGGDDRTHRPARCVVERRRRRPRR